MKSELLGKVQSMVGEVQGLRDEVDATERRLREVSTSHAPWKEPVLAGSGVASLWGLFGVLGRET